MMICSSFVSLIRPTTTTSTINNITASTASRTTLNCQYSPGQQNILKWKYTVKQQSIVCEASCCYHVIMSCHHVISRYYTLIYLHNIYTTVLVLKQQQYWWLVTESGGTPDPADQLAWLGESSFYRGVQNKQSNCKYGGVSVRCSHIYL